MNYGNFMSKVKTNLHEKVSKAILFSVITFSAAQLAPAAYATSLDTSFGTGGKVTTDFFGATNANYSTIVDSNGKIVAAGSAIDSGTLKFALARYLTNGTLDTAFGTGGKVTLSNAADPYGITSIMEQADGKYVAVGTSKVTANKSTTALIRFNTDGSLDTTFGTGGITIVAAIGNLIPLAATLDSQERIVFTGGYRNSIFVARFTTTGAPDTTFSQNGIVRTKQANGADSYARAIGIDSTGKIVVAGFVAASPGFTWIVQRYKKSGKLDTTFNTTGQMTVPFPASTSNIANALALKSDDSIYVGGSAQVGTDNLALVHVLANGTFDTSFGTSGFTILDPMPGFGAASSIRAMKLDANGDIIGMGSVAYNSTGGEFVAMRFTTAGALDTTFASPTGFQMVKFGTDNNLVSSVAIQTDGKIVGGGYIFDGSKYLFAVLRIVP